MATEPPLLLRLQSDARLAALAAGGYRLAFAALAHRHRPALLRAARRLGAGEEAEDLVQQTLLAAWQALSQGAKVHSPRAWLFAILRHLQAVQARRGAPWAPIGELPDNRSVEDQVANRLELRELVAALRSLPEHQRAALLAQTLAGASRKELSESLGVSEAGVRSLLYRARATLRAGLTALTPLLLLKRLCASEPALAQSAAELPAAATAGAASLAGKAAIALLAIGGAVGGITAGSGFTASRGGRPRPAPAPASATARGVPRPDALPSRLPATPAPSAERQSLQLAAGRKRRASAPLPRETVSPPVPPPPASLPVRTVGAERPQELQEGREGTKDAGDNLGERSASRPEPPVRDSKERARKESSETTETADGSGGEEGSSEPTDTIRTTETTSSEGGGS